VCRLGNTAAAAAACCYGGARVISGGGGGESVRRPTDRPTDRSKAASVAGGSSSSPFPHTPCVAVGVCVYLSSRFYCVNRSRAALAL